MTVLLLGDSNAYRSIPYQPPSVTVDATVGIRTNDTSWSTRIPADLASVSPDFIVVQLGTNDVHTNRLTNLFPRSLDTIMSLIPPDIPVHWNIVRVVKIDSPREQRRYTNRVHFINAAMNDAAARYPNLTIENLPAHFAGHPEWVRPEDLHLMPDGLVEYARWNLENLGLT